MINRNSQTEPREKRNSVFFLKNKNDFTKKLKQDLGNSELIKIKDFVVQRKAKIEGSVKVKCLYFGANWSEPCQKFNKELVKFYNDVNKKEKRLEILYLSLDQSEIMFDLQIQKFPWLSYEFNQSQHWIEEKCQSLNVNSIPRLIILNSKPGEGIIALPQVTQDVIEANNFQESYTPINSRIPVKNQLYTDYMEEIQESERRNNTVIPQEDWKDGPEKVFEKWCFFDLK